jgi:hypothetical protein
VHQQNLPSHPCHDATSPVRTALRLRSLPWSTLPWWLRKHPRKTWVSMGITLILAEAKQQWVPFSEFQNTILQPDVHIIDLLYQVIMLYASDCICMSRLVTVTKNRRTHHTIRLNARTRCSAGCKRAQVKGDSARIAEWLVSMWGFPWMGRCANNWMVVVYSLGIRQ